MRRQQPAIRSLPGPGRDGGQDFVSGGPERGSPSRLPDRRGRHERPTRPSGTLAVMTAVDRVELLLVSGERRLLTLTSHSGSVGNYLSRLDDWVETHGGWVQKCHIVEVRLLPAGDGRPESTEELRQLNDAAGLLAEARIQGKEDPEST